MRASEFRVLKRRLKRKSLYQVVFKVNGQPKSRLLTLLSFQADAIRFKELKQTVFAKDLLSIKKMGFYKSKNESLMNNLLDFKKAKQLYKEAQAVLAY